MGGHANVTLCGRNAKDKKIQNISEIEQKSPVLTRTLSIVPDIGAGAVPGDGAAQDAGGGVRAFGLCV